MYYQSNSLYSSLYSISMQSKVYPNILYLKNQNLCFMGSTISTEQLVLLHPSDPLNTHYTALTKKLFSEINIIKQMLWIGRILSTDIIRIYFSQPYEYPVGQCCRSPLFVQIDNGKSGGVVCSKCRREVVKFVRAGQGETPEQEVFRRTRREMRVRKEQLRELLTSQKFRDRRLKNNFVGQKLPKQCDLIIQISTIIPGSEPQSRSAEAQSQSIKQLKDIMNDIFS